MKRNKTLRLQIAEMIYNAGEGHIPSAYSIVEILRVLYDSFLKFRSGNPSWPGRDYFILSKGHGCAALYAILAEYGFIRRRDLERKSRHDGILGGHPDATKVPGVEASTGSLGHGIGIALGMALGLKIQKKPNRVITLIGDGECNEGTVWENAMVAPSMKLGNFCVIVDDNGSTQQILPLDHMARRWKAFGWETYEVDGHSEGHIRRIMSKLSFSPNGVPKAIIARTIKGKGVSFLEGHGVWHSKVPSSEEMEAIRKELS